MRQGSLHLLSVIGIGQCIASYLVNVQDLFSFVLWYYLLFLLANNNLTHFGRALIQAFFALILSMHIYPHILGEANNFEINGVTFLAVLILKDTLYTFIFNLISFERIQVTIKAFSVVLFTFVLVSVYIACVAYMKFYLTEWVGDGLLDYRSNFVSCWDITRAIQQDKIIDISDHDLSGTQTTYAVGSNVRSVYFNRQSLYKDMKVFPKVKYLIKRYPGEGAILECAFNLDAERSKQFYPINIFISKDRLDIHNSYRHNIQTLTITESDSLLYNISLEIYALEKEDFGTYRAGIRVSQNRSEKVLLQSASQLVDEIELYICIFSISRIDEYYTYKYVPVGGLLSFRNFFLVLVSNSNHLRVEHTVNGVQLNSIPGISTECCLNSIQFATFNISDMKLAKDIDFSNHKFEIFDVVADICLCPSLYGIHRIKFYHDLYNPREKKWITVECMHPQITVVYPTSPALPWTNVSEQERFLIESSKKNNDFSLFRGTSFLYLQSAKAFEIIVMNNLEHILLFGTAVILMIAMYCSLLFLLYLIDRMIWGIVKIEIPFQRALGHQGQQAHGSNTENPVSTSDAERNTYVYDAFVSNVEEDRHFVMHILRPILQQYRLRVFFGDDDLPSGPVLDNLQVAFNQSEVALIVISEDYVTDRFCKLFFSSVVLPSLHEGIISCNKIVLIKYKPCEIPMTWVTHDKIVVVKYTGNI